LNHAHGPRSLLCQQLQPSSPFLFLVHAAPLSAACMRGPRATPRLVLCCGGMHVDRLGLVSNSAIERSTSRDQAHTRKSSILLSLLPCLPLAACHSPAAVRGRGGGGGGEAHKRCLPCRLTAVLLRPLLHPAYHASTSNDREPLPSPGACWIKKVCCAATSPRVQQRALFDKMSRSRHRRSRASTWGLGR
jgi:hypothetical protein